MFASMPIPLKPGTMIRIFRPDGQCVVYCYRYDYWDDEWYYFLVGHYNTKTGEPFRAFRR